MAGEVSQVHDVQNEVSEDRTTVTGRLIVGPYGVYDPEKQPTEEEIIAMKAEFNRVGVLDNAAPHVCAQIVLGMLTTTDTSDPFFNSKTAIEAGITDDAGAPVYFTRNYKTPFDLAINAGYLTGYWTQGLTRACALPGAEWPEGMTPPATFAEGLREFKIEEIADKIGSLVNKWEAEGDHFGAFAVDEVTKLEVETKDPESEPLYLCRAGLVRAIEEGQRYELEQFTVNPDNSVLRLTQSGQFLGDERVPDEDSEPECPANLVELISIANRLARVINDEIIAERL